MEKIRIDNIDRRVGPASVKRPLTDAIDAAHVALNYYELAPGEYQQGINTSDERVVALAIGAPQATGETEILRECPACDTIGYNHVSSFATTGWRNRSRSYSRQYEERTPHTVERIDDGQATRARCLVCGEQTDRFE